MTHIQTVVVGHKGFIGRHVVDYFDRLKIPYIVFNGDLLVKNEIETFFKKSSVQTAIFLVGSFYPPFESQVQINVLTLSNFLEVATKYGLKKIVYVSSGAVYGQPSGKESLESDILFPNTTYGLAKLFAEECIHFFHRKSLLQYVILRFPNVYGEGNNKGVVFDFMNQIKSRGEITVAGDGTQTRNFLHVSDACLAIEKALLYKKSDIFNVSNPTNVSINQLVGFFKKLYKFDVKYTKSSNDLKSLSLNIDKARKLLGFEPKVKSVKIPKI